MSSRPHNLPTHRPDPLAYNGDEYAHLGRDVAGYGPKFALEDYKFAMRKGTFADGTLPVLPPIVRCEQEESPDGTVTKFLLRVPGTEKIALGAGAETGVPEGELPAGLDTESVLIPMIGKSGRRTYTLCVSSQVGCAMGCTFCETAQMGLIRSLTAREIVAQWFTAAYVLNQRPTNIVFMGMGEPLDNYDNVIKAIEILIDHRGAGFPASKITISTVGRVDGLTRLAAQVHNDGWRRLNLAFSLNSARDEVRNQIMPLNRKWNLAELQQTFMNFPRYGGGKIMFEYVLIPGVNDSEADAQAVAEYVAPFRLPDGRHRICLNLIPYNPRRNSPWPAPDEDRVTWFMGQLMDRQVFVKRRRTKGRTMMGACGQLGNEQIRSRKIVPLGIKGKSAEC